jgi:peptide/nickel transport system substrate-binding protein
MFIGFHIGQDSPFANNLVRQAMNYGVNVDQIVDDLLEGYGERYGSWVNPPHNNPELTPWPYDPDLARELLTQAGYQQGFTTTLLIPSDVYDQDVAIAEAVARQLKEIGIAVTVKSADWPVYVRTLMSGDPPPLFLLGLNSRGNDLEDVKNMSSSFAFNPTNWEDGQFEEHLKNARGEFNEVSRDRLLDQAQKIAYDAAPWIWLWKDYKFYGVSEGLDWSPRRDGLVHLYQSAVRPD